MANDMEPRTGRGVSRRGSGGIRPLHTLALVGVGVVGVLVAFWVLSSIAGLVWFFVKVAAIIGVIGGLAWLLLGRGRRHKGH